MVAAASHGRGPPGGLSFYSAPAVGLQVKNGNCSALFGVGCSGEESLGGVGERTLLGTLQPWLPVSPSLLTSRGAVWRLLCFLGLRVSVE